MRMKTWIAVGLAGLAVVAGGYLGACQLVRPSTTAGEPSQPQVVTVQKGALESTVSASGSLTIPHQAKLTFGTSGTLERLEVSEGSVVKKGQVIAGLDGDTVASLELSLTQAELNLKIAQRDLARIDDQVADAEAAVKQAETGLVRAKRELAIAEKNTPITLQNTREQLYPSDDELADAEGAWKQAETALEKAKRELAIAQQKAPLDLLDTWTQLYNNPGTPNPGEKYELARRQSENNLTNAQNAVSQAEETARKAKARLSELQTGAKVSMVEDKYEAARLQADNTVANARASVSQAEETLRKAKISLANIKDRGAVGPTDLEIQQLRVAANQGSLEQARQKKGKAVLAAPFDGVIAGLPVLQGDQISGGTIIATLVDTSSVEMKAIVDELDILLVKEGQEVHITLEAQRSLPLKGRVKVISPVASRQSGVVSYSVTIGLEGPQRFQLREGLTATAGIVTARKEGVLLVPSNAIRLEGRQRLVRVLHPDGSHEDRPITTGISDGRRTEVTSGLTEGEQVEVAASRATPAGQAQGSGPGLLFR